MTRGQLALIPFADVDSAGGDLERSAIATIDALRSQNAIQPWHELDCRIVLELSKAVAESRGIAKSQMFGALLAARSRLPEPIATEDNPDLIVYEAEREAEWFRVHGDANAALADVPHGADADPIQ